MPLWHLEAQQDVRNLREAFAHTSKILTTRLQTEAICKIHFIAAAGHTASSVEHPNIDKQRDRV